MSQNNCSDVFGKRVSQSLYCVQLKIGNNSGHPLQLAGVGFAKSLKALDALKIPQVTIANTSYASTRAVLVQSQVWSTRNLVANSVVGTGLIMAGFTPYFARPHAKANFATATSIVSGPLLQAFNLLFPDPIVTQLKSLDDQSFRDNMIIPNNSQVQTVVFVEKQNLTVALHELQIELSAAAGGAQEKMTTATGDAKLRAQVTANSIAELQADSDSTIKNSTRPKLWKGNPNPLLVKLALGSIVIVGDEIEYLERVQIQNSAAPSGVAVTLNPVAPQVAVSTTQPFTATVVNDQNGAGVSWALSGSNCQAAACGTLTNQTTTTVTYTAPNAQPSPINAVTLTATSKADTTKSGTATITVTLMPPISVVVTPNPAAATHGGTPIPFTAVVQNDTTGAGVNWSLSGSGCAGATCGSLANNTITGVTYTPPSAQPSPSTVTLTATSLTDRTKSGVATITIN